MCKRGGAMQRIEVATGIRDDSNWEITSGLQEGDPVLSRLAKRKHNKGKS